MINKTYLYAIIFLYAFATIATEAPADFFSCAKQQPPEFTPENHWECDYGADSISGHVTVLDLHYKPTAPDNTIIAYTIKNEQPSPRIYLYNPEQIAITQILPLTTPIPPKTKLGGAFSENGRFLTIGLVRSLCEAQDFHVYEDVSEKIRMRAIAQGFPAILGIIPLQKLILEYEYAYETHQRLYAPHPIVQYRPSLMRTYLTGWKTVFDRFAYDSATQTIACYGDAVNIEDDVMAYSAGSIQPIGMVDASGKNNMLSCIVPQVPRCTYQCEYDTESENWQYISSPNKRYIIYETNPLVNKDSDGYSFVEQYIFLDRLTGKRHKVSYIPRTIDNTGTLCLKGSASEKDAKVAALEIMSVKNLHDPLYSISYPHSRAVSSSFGDKNTTYTCLNYCFIRNMETHQMGTPIAIGILVPPHKENRPTSRKKGLEPHQQMTKWLLKKPAPTLKQLTMAHASSK